MKKGIVQTLKIERLVLECKCYIKEANGVEPQIIKCPLCKSAPALYEACKVAQIWLEGLVRVNPKMLNSAGRQAVSNDLTEALAKADGGK